MNKDKRLASFLTTLLCGCIVTEASLGTYVGLKLFMARQEQEFENARYEAYLEEQEQRRENPPKIQYAGPTMRVVDGVLMDWDDNIIPDPVPVESGSTAPAVSVPKSNLEENTAEQQTTSKPADSVDSNADSSGLAKPSSNSSGGSNQSGSSDKSNSSGSGSSGSSSNKAPSKADTSGNTTVYVSDNASKIHSKSNCSGMKNYREMTKSEADANNYEYCQNCWN